MGTNNVIHKTGRTQRIAMPPTEDLATAISNMQRKFVENFGMFS